MVIYVICFLLSIAFAYLAKRSKRRAMFIFLSILSIAVTVTLAGLRDVSIGIDTSNYYKGTWATAMMSSSLRSYFRNILRSSSSRFEVLFTILVGLAAKGTGSFHVFKFMIHAIIIVCVYVGAFRMREHADPVFTLLLFYFLYYNHSLNISRQYVSMAIIFAAAADIEHRKILRYLLLVFVATLFHNTGLLGLMPLMIYLVLYPQKRLRNVSLTRRLFIIALIAAVYVGFVPLIQLLLSKGVLSAHYATYVRGVKEPIPGSVIIMLFAEAALLALCWKSFRANNKYGDFFLFTSVMFLVLYCMAPMIYYGKRVAAYLSFINIITVGMTTKTFQRKSNQRIIKGLVVFFAAAYWLYFYAYMNGSRTVPYILGV